MAGTANPWIHDMSSGLGAPLQTRSRRPAAARAARRAWPTQGTTPQPPAPAQQRAGVQGSAGACTQPVSHTRCVPSAHKGQLGRCPCSGCTPLSCGLRAHAATHAACACALPARCTRCKGSTRAALLLTPDQVGMSQLRSCACSAGPSQASPTCAPGLQQWKLWACRCPDLARDVHGQLVEGVFRPLLAP